MPSFNYFLLINYNANNDHIIIIAGGEMLNIIFKFKNMCKTNEKFNKL